MKSIQILSLCSALLLATACSSNAGNKAFVYPTDIATGQDIASLDDAVTPTDDTATSDIPVGSDTATSDVPASTDTAVSDAPKCQSTCTANTKQCSGAGWQLCQDPSDSGCFSWSAVTACPANSVCKAGACIKECPKQDCTVMGAKKCDVDGNVAKCGDYDGDGCLEWGGAVTCPGNQVCSQGFCAISCTNACTTVGAKKCDANNVLTCGDSDGDGCLDWGASKACGSQVCSAGFCADTCTSACTQVGAKKCDGNGVTTCGDFNADGCLEWGTTVGCGATQVCSNGACADTCSSECTVAGAKKCDLDAVQTCGDYNKDGCLEWSTSVACAQGLVCQSGNCASTCTNGCTVANAKQCDAGGNVVVCGDYNSDGCLEWGTPVACTNGTVCSAGSCAATCSDACSTKNQKQCVAGGTAQFQVCDDYNGDGCLEWGTAQDCGASLTCSGNGVCAATCTGTCTTAGDKQCLDSSVQTCGDYNKDGCLEWGTAVACELYQACSAGACVQKSASSIVIQEVVYDSVGTDTETFVELRGPKNTTLDGYVLVGVNGNGGADYNSIALTGKIPDSGLFLIANTNATAGLQAKAQQKSALVDYGNGPDSIQLRFGSIVVDALGYGTFGVTDKFAGEKAAAKDVAPGHSLGRDALGTDTDDNSKDFKDYATPTPGADNVVANLPPVAKLTCPLGAAVGIDGTYDASASSDPDGTIADYSFDFGDGSAVKAGTNSSYLHAFATAGKYTVTVTVMDNGGLTNSANCAMTVTSANPPTVTIVKPQATKQVAPGDAVAVTLDATPPAGKTITQVELLADGVVVGTSTAAPYTFTYNVPMNATLGGTISLVGRATDSGGGVGLSTPAVLSVLDSKPVASFTVVVSGTLKVVCDATASTDVETPAANLQVRWDFENDGIWDTDWSTTRIAEHTYAAEGTYTVKMDVRDSVQQISEATKSVTLSLMQYVSGAISTTTWTGTVVVTGDISVASGQTLTIAKGTSVLFAYMDQNKDGVGDYDLTVNGKLVVQGTDAEPVVFTVYGATNKAAKAWNRITLSGQGSSIDHAIIEYAQVGLDIFDTSTVSNTTLRFCETDMRVMDTSAVVTASQLTVQSATKNGIEIWDGGKLTFSVGTVSGNGRAGIAAMGVGSNLTGTLLTISGNHLVGVEISGGVSGVVQQCNITGNDYEGVRIQPQGPVDPTITVNYNNIAGNAVVGARVVANVSVSIASVANDYTTKSSATWATPKGEPIDAVRYDYSEYDSGYVSGSIAAVPSGNSIVSVSTGTSSRWADVTATPTSQIQAKVTDSSYSYYGAMNVSQVAYNQAGAVKEVSVLTQSGTVDVRSNWLGTFPKVLDVVTLGSATSATLHGFVGAAFDGTWSKGPYYGGGNLNDTTWSGTVWITGDVTLPAGKTLTIQPGTTVQIVRFDQDVSGMGDFKLVFSGTVACQGSSGSPVLFTMAGVDKSSGAWDSIRVTGASAVSNFAYTTFEYGRVGVQIESGTHTLGHVTVQKNGENGLVITGASSITATATTASSNGKRGIAIDSSAGVAFDGVTIEQNATDGFAVSSSNTGMTLKNATIDKNGACGVWVDGATVAVSQSNINYNGQGVTFHGAASGSLKTSNVKYNNAEGIVLASSSTSNPAPVINSNNIYGNSVTGGGVIAAPNVSMTSIANDYTTKTSAPWATPKGEKLLGIQVIYTEYDSGYVSGYVKANDGSGATMFSASTGTSTRWVDVASYAASALVCQITDSSYSYYGSMTVPMVYYRSADAANELSAWTDAGTVDCKTNYWGVFPDVLSKTALSRSDAIAVDGYVGAEMNGTGPQ